MARLPRICPPGIAQHIIQRGNNRQPCFANLHDYAAYAKWLHEASQKYEVDVHAWVFMTNHVHLLVTPHDSDSVSRMMQTVGRRYVRYFNQAYQRTGTLWEGRFKSCLVDTEDYLLSCQRYIEMNPVRAGMVDDPADYHWSSYQANALGIPSRLCVPHATYLSLAGSEPDRQSAYRGLFIKPLDDRLIDEIRGSVNRGLALGNERFKRELEELTGRRVTPLKPGPKSR